MTRDGIAGCLFMMSNKPDQEIRDTLRRFMILKGCSEPDCDKILSDLHSYPEYQPKEPDHA